jgi:transposase InsO family protein
MTDSIGPKDHAEAVALFRAQVIGELLLCERTSHGELAEAIRQLAARPVRAPGALVAHCYSPPTIQRWYYAYRQGGLAALHPKSRSAGNGQALTDAERELLLAVRRDHPRVSASLILRTLETTGKLRPGILSRQTLRRLYRSEGLDRQTLKQHDAQPRRRWEAQAPNALWHTDVCHGPALTAGKRSVPLRVHALLDDHSRYVVAIQACPTERESEMLALTVKALRLHGAPDMIYADNGPTYVGDALSTVCGRLGIGLLHAKPYDPQARGKMERFWRTLREQCLDHVGSLGSHHDVQVRLLAWLDRHYHVTPHSSLMGKTPAETFEAAPRKPIDEPLLREALVAHGRRRIRRDGTVQIAGKEFEVEQGFLAGRLVTIGRSLLTPTEVPWVEHEDQRLILKPVDAKANAKARRLNRTARGIDAVPFDPPTALLHQATGKKAGDQ